MSELRAAIDFVERTHPLPRCKHNQALRDAAGEPPCGCRATEGDVVETVENLLAQVPAFPWHWTPGRTQQYLCGPNGNLAQLTMPVPRDRPGEAPRDDYRALAELIATAPDLLRRLVDELKETRAERDELQLQLQRMSGEFLGA